MQWRTGRQSGNVEDQRGMGVGNMLPVGGGIGTIVIALAIYLLGGNPAVVLNPSSGSGGSSSRQTNSGSGTKQNDEGKKFVSVVLGSTEDVWGNYFKQQGRQYKEPKLVLFSGQVRSACGIAGSATGPFYCPNDQKLYIDLSFFRELSDRFGAPGDFAQAYVIAHEVGHHVQNQLGTLDKVDSLKSRVSEREANQLSVRTELQADFYAGLWAHYAKKEGILDPGDVEEALNAASAIGDDRLQKESRGYVVPDSFTHGSSQQRVEWFNKGFRSGNASDGNTFTRDFR